MIPVQSWEPWVELLEVPGLGPRYWHRLLSVLGSPENILRADVGQFKGVIPDRVTQAIVNRTSAREAIVRTQAWLAAEGNRAILTWADARYPSSLLNLPDPPPVIFYHGCLELLERPMLAMVGGA